MAKAKAAAPAAKSVTRGVSSMKPGTGSKRVDTTFIVLYGAPKVRKTTSASTLEGAKWLISDPNCIPTLRALGRLPADEDIYEAKSLAEAREILADAIRAAEEGTLGVPAFVVDSLTQFADWHQEDVARATGQRWLGDNAKDNGWNQFNVTFGELFNDLAILSKYVTTVAIAHAKEKPDTSKGTFGGMALGPNPSLKLGRLANWVLYQTIERRDMRDDENIEPDDYLQVDEVRGKKVITETIIHTQPYYQWFASANAKNLGAEEPADLRKMLEKEGLWR